MPDGQQLARFTEDQSTTLYSVNADLRGRILDFYAPSAQDIWVLIGISGLTGYYFMHYDGHAWTRVDLASGFIPDGYYSDGFLENASWLDVIPEPTTTNDSSPPPARYPHLFNGQWVLTEPSFQSMEAVLDVSPTENWAVGMANSLSQNGTWISSLGIYHYQNGTWLP